MAATTSQIATIAQAQPKSQSLWADSFRRLRRNVLAMMGLIVIIFYIFVAIFAPFIAPQPYDVQDLTAARTAPTWVTQIFPSMRPVGTERGYVKINEDYILGADDIGRDLLSRIIYGTRVSLIMAFVGPTVAITIGLVVGLLSGYLGGWVDNLLMRIVEIMYAFPTLLFVILLMAFFRLSFAEPEPGTLAYTLGELDQATGGMLFIFIGIGMTSWMQMARLVRGQVLSLREREFVEAANALGARPQRIIWSHILPNVLGPIIVAETLAIPTYISYEAFLSFIGLGVVPPTPSWGIMISDGARQITSYPNMAIFPSVALFLLVFAFNFLGDGLRDALDPRMRGAD
jgi:oligopeptide transport system permease protein